MVNLIYTNLYPFSFLHLRVVVQAEQLVILPEFKGSAIHGAFGHSLRKTVCPFHYKQCRNDCIMHDTENCFYQYIYETRVPSTKEFKNDKNIRNYKGKQPSPFIISNAFGQKKEYQPGEIFSFDITLLGKAREYISYIIYAFDIMCKTGIGKDKRKCLLQSVHAVNRDGKMLPVYLHDTQIIKPLIFPITLKDLVSNYPHPDVGRHVTLKFNTRLEINTKGKFPDINFDILFRRLLARVITTARLHCGIKYPDIDFQEISQTAKTVETVSSSLCFENAQRYSSRQKRSHPFGGLIGKITFKSDNWEPFWPILLLGEKIHVGKKTSFGLGNYTIIHS